MNLIFTMLVASQVALGTGPDATTRVVVQDLAKVAIFDRPFVRYLSLATVPDAELERWVRLKGFWVNSMSTERAVTNPEPIIEGERALERLLKADRSSRLLRIDIRDYGWNAVAWRAVAVREPFHREPWINSAVAKIARDFIGEVQDVKSNHVIVVVRGDWFFRETAETDRSTSYYDLLYARKRFPAGSVAKTENVPLETATQTVKKKVRKLVDTPWEGGPYHDPKTGQLVPYKNPKTGQLERDWPKGEFVYKKEIEVEIDEVVALPEKINVAVPKNDAAIDFPKDKDEWNRAWNLDNLGKGDALRNTKFQTANGAIAFGMNDDPKNGSFVARSNRLLTFQPCETGVSLESFDVLDATGDRDFVRNAPNIAKGKITFDAQELLVNLPNGGQAAMLVAGGKRVEVADNKVAIDNDPSDRRVRTPGSCIVCHAVSYGVIPPINMVDRFFGPKTKNPLVFNNKDLERDFRGFFLNWERKIEPVYQTPYKIMIEQSTAFGDKKAWTGLEVSKAVTDMRHWYDKSLALEQVCIETGMTKEEFGLVTAQSTDPWVALLKRGEVVPRRAWDVDVFPDVMKLWAVFKLKPLDERGKP